MQELNRECAEGGWRSCPGAVRLSRQDRLSYLGPEEPPGGGAGPGQAASSYIAMLLLDECIKCAAGARGAALAGM